MRLKEHVQTFTAVYISKNNSLVKYAYYKLGSKGAWYPKSVKYTIFVFVKCNRNGHSKSEEFRSYNIQIMRIYYSRYKRN